jgi:hypothetical protein
LLEDLLIRWHLWLQVHDILEFLVKFRSRRRGTPVMIDCGGQSPVSRTSASP